MKKGIYLLAAIALMASCSQEEVFVDTPEAHPEIPRLIGFETFVDKATRATNYANNSNALNFFYPTFKVYGWKTVGGTPTSVFDGVTVSYYDAENAAETTLPTSEWGENPTTGWYYENIRYWDKLATSYQFSAYTPATAAAECTADGTINIGTETEPVTVDVKNLMEEPADELAFKGFATDYMTATSTVATSPVSLNFKHLQAKLNIRILLADEVVTAQNIAIKKIQVHNLANKAYYKNDNAVGVSGWTLGEADADYVPSITEVQDGYSLNDATTNFDGYYVLEQLIIPQTIEKYSKPQHITKPDEEENNDNTLNENISDDDTYITDEDTENKENDILPLPSEENILLSLTEYSQACVYVEYTIGAETFKSFTPLANIFIGNGNEASYTFLGGNQYTLNITVGPKPIEFTAEVTPWAEGADKELPMD